MTAIRDFYCHDFTFKGYPEESRVEEVNFVEGGEEILVQIWGRYKNKVPFLLARGYLPFNVMLTVCEKEC